MVTKAGRNDRSGKMGNVWAENGAYKGVKAYRRALGTHRTQNQGLITKRKGRDGEKGAGKASAKSVTIPKVPTEKRDASPNGGPDRGFTNNNRI